LFHSPDETLFRLEDGPNSYEVHLTPTAEGKVSISIIANEPSVAARFASEPMKLFSEWGASIASERKTFGIQDWALIQFKL